MAVPGVALNVILNGSLSRPSVAGSGAIPALAQRPQSAKTQLGVPMPSATLFFMALGIRGLVQSCVDDSYEHIYTCHKSLLPYRLRASALINRPFAARGTTTHIWD